jgi:hypothetical protein
VVAQTETQVQAQCEYGDETHTATDYWASDHHSTYVKLGLSDVKTELVVLGDFAVGLAPVQ